MNYYRVLVGIHVDDKGKEYPTGTIVATETDLVAKFNSPNSRKFEQVTKEEAEVFAAKLAREKNKGQRGRSTQDAGLTENDNLEKMTIEELRKKAADEEIELGNATKKEDIIKVIRGVVTV